MPATGTVIEPRAQVTLPAAGRDNGLRTLRFTSFTCDVQLATLNPGVSLRSMRQKLEQWGRRLSRFDPASEVNLLIRRGGRWTDVSAELHEMLALALRAAINSRGMFNVTVPSSPGDGPVPALTEVLELGRGRARLRPGATVDFGGLAKGVWADRLREMLGPDAACSIGGDVACRGRGPSGEGWPVSLPDGRIVVLQRGALATSGIGRRRRADGHHIVDPRTGRPSTSDVRTASVIAPRGANAEWKATALVVGGSALEPDLCRGSATAVLLQTGDK